jgi:hypothetical protein
MPRKSDHIAISAENPISFWSGKIISISPDRPWPSDFTGKSHNYKSLARISSPIFEHPILDCKAKAAQYQHGRDGKEVGPLVPGLFLLGVLAWEATEFAPLQLLAAL